MLYGDTTLKNFNFINATCFTPNKGDEYPQHGKRVYATKQLWKDISIWNKAHMLRPRPAKIAMLKYVNVFWDARLVNDI